MRISDWSSDVCSSDLPASRREIRASSPNALGIPFWYACSPKWPKCGRPTPLGWRAPSFKRPRSLAASRGPWHEQCAWNRGPKVDGHLEVLWYEKIAPYAKRLRLSGIAAVQATCSISTTADRTGTAGLLHHGSLRKRAAGALPGWRRGIGGKIGRAHV